MEDADEYDYLFGLPVKILLKLEDLNSQKEAIQKKYVELSDSS